MKFVKIMEIIIKVNSQHILTLRFIDSQNY